MRKAIEIRDLSFRYPDGSRAITGIQLDIAEGESVGVIGPNGAGKSTLLLHLNGLLNGEGIIKIFDKPITKGNLAFIRRTVGFVFQDPQDQLFMPTVYEDVAFGPSNLGLPKEEITRKVTYMLSQLGLLGQREHSSHHLSLGQQRRLSLATVLVMNPEILVLDEPNSNLDHASRRYLINLLKDLPITKIIATHDLEMVLDVCRRVILIDRGQVVSDGVTEEMLSNQSLLEAHNLEVPPSMWLDRCDR